MLLNLTLLTHEYKLCKQVGFLEVDMKYIENNYEPAEMNTTATCWEYLFISQFDVFN